MISFSQSAAVGKSSLNLPSIFQAYLSRYVHKIVIRGRRATGLCPFHADQHPSFSADLERCIWFCHACNHGGGVKRFAELIGEPWGNNIRCASGAARAHHLALAAARQEYKAWARRRLIELTDQYRLLSDELEIAIIAYRAINRRPDVYSNEEKSFWTHRLTSIYDRSAVLEHDLDILTFQKLESVRLVWWEEEGHGPLAA